MNKISSIGLKMTSAASFLLLGSCSLFQQPSPHIFHSRGGHMPEPTHSSRRVTIGSYQAPAAAAIQTQPEISGGLEIITESEVPESEIALEPEITIPQVATITYIVKKNESLWSIAHAHGVTAKELARVNGLSDKAGLKIKQKLELPAGARFIAKAQRPVVKTTPAFSGASQKYKVKAGDSVSVIAWRFKTSQKALRRANALRSDKLRIGQTLVIPNKNNPRNRATSSRRSAVASVKGGTYRVQKGDSLSVIAQKHNIKTSALMKANRLNLASVLQVGKKLVIPGGRTLVAKTTKKLSSPKPRQKKSEPEAVITNDFIVDNRVNEQPADVIEESFEPTQDVVEEPEVNILPEGLRTVEALVVENDTLESLALDYNSTIDLIRMANPTIQSNEDLKAGILINIPRKK